MRVPVPSWQGDRRPMLTDEAKHSRQSTRNLCYLRILKSTENCAVVEGGQTWRGNSTGRGSPFFPYGFALRTTPVRDQHWSMWTPNPLIQTPSLWPDAPGKGGQGGGRVGRSPGCVYERTRTSGSPQLLVREWPGPAQLQELKWDSSHYPQKVE